VSKGSRRPISRFILNVALRPLTSINNINHTLVVIGSEFDRCLGFALNAAVIEAYNTTIAAILLSQLPLVVLVLTPIRFLLMFKNAT
jgi:hypothetical protein